MDYRKNILEKKQILKNSCDGFWVWLTPWFQTSFVPETLILAAAESRRLCCF